MCEYIKKLFNFLFNNYPSYNVDENIKYKDKFICPICSCNMLNTVCYEIECENFRQKILL